MMSSGMMRPTFPGQMTPTTQAASVNATGMSGGIVSSGPPVGGVGPNSVGGMEGSQQAQQVQQQQQSVPPSLQQQQPSTQLQMKQMNTAMLCKVGAETVQEIVLHTIEVFTQLKTFQINPRTASSENVHMKFFASSLYIQWSCQLPNETAQSAQNTLDRKLKIQDHLKFSKNKFALLHYVYHKVNEDCSGMDYTPIETLIPYKDDIDSRPELNKKTTDTYRECADEVRKLREHLCLKARYQKEVIEKLRKIIWDINTILALSQPGNLNFRFSES